MAEEEAASAYIEDSAKHSQEAVVAIEKRLGIEGNYDLDSYLFGITKGNFKDLWGDQSNMLDLTGSKIIPRLAGIYVLFFKFDDLSTVIKQNKEIYGDGLKRNNIWYNEIRENALLNLFDIDTNEFKDFLIQHFTSDRETTVNILELYQEWISTLLHCGDLAMKKHKEVAHDSSSSAKAPPIVYEEGKPLPTHDVAHDDSTSVKVAVDADQLQQGVAVNLNKVDSPEEVDSPAEENYPFVIRSIQKRGGQSYPYDFELMISETYETPRNELILVKIEFKFSGHAKTSIKQLAQFGSANTESAGALTIFGDSSYLDFFWNQKTDTENPNSPTFFQQMCIDVKYPTELSEYNDPAFVVDQTFLEKLNRTLDFDKDTWKTQAKGVEIKAPIGTPIYNFHTYLRGEVQKNPAKKNTVNESFGKFIASNIEDPRTGIKNRLVDVISNLFNDKQVDKYFCIFSSGVFSVATIPNFNLNMVTQDSEKPFIFYLINSGNSYNIKCDMSWGNGGAGNQNPRILFKLIGGTEEDVQDEPEDPQEELQAAAKPAAKASRRTSTKDPLKIAAKLQEKDAKKAAAAAAKAEKAAAKAATLAAAKAEKAARGNPPAINEESSTEAEGKNPLENLGSLGGDGSDSDSEEGSEQAEEDEEDEQPEEDEEDEQPEEDEEESYDYDWFTMHEELARGDQEGYQEEIELNKATSNTYENGESIEKVFSSDNPPKSLKHIRERQRAIQNRGQLRDSRFLSPDGISMSARVAKLHNELLGRIIEDGKSVSLRVAAAKKEGTKGGKKTKKTNIKKNKKTKRKNIKKLNKLTKRKNKKNKKTKRR